MKTRIFEIGPDSGPRPDLDSVLDFEIDNLGTGVKWGTRRVNFSRDYEISERTVRSDF